MADLPKGWKMTSLGEILTPEQIGRTVEIMRKPVKDTEKTKLLSDYYKTFADQLSQKGIVPDFLAYAAPYWIEKAMATQAEQEMKDAADITKSFFDDRRN